MPVHRCEWCGRFFFSPVPDAYGCPNHILEANAKLEAEIRRFNERLKQSAAPQGKE